MTAVEVAFVATPFLFGLLAIFEVALTFLGSQTLQMSVDNVSRQIRTGEARGTALATRVGFIDAVCSQAIVLHDCENKLQVDIRTYPTFQGLQTLAPLDDAGAFLPDMQFTVGRADSIVVARAFYKREPIAPVFSNSPAVLADGSVLISAALVFQNEPFE